MSVIRFVLLSILALFVLLPAAGLLSIAALPIFVVLGVVAIPVLGLLLLVGLPILAVVLLAVVAIGITFGLLGAVVGLGVAALKIAFFIALPVFVISWLVGKATDRGKKLDRV
jgi:hypothetical protein